MFATPGDLGSIKAITRTARTLTPKGISLSRTIPKGSALVVCIGATIGKVGLAVEDMTANQQINFVIPQPEVDSNFLYYALLEQAPYVRRLAGDSPLPIITKSDFGSCLSLAVPPHAEQRRIAAVLDVWDEAITTTGHLIKALSSRRAALSRLVFGESTATVALGTVGRLEKGRGLTKADVADIGVPCLRYAEIYTWYGDTARQLVSRASAAAALSSRRLLPGEIVFASSGETAEEIGKAVAYLGEEPAVVGGDTVILTGHNHNAAFLAHALNSPFVVRQKSAAGKGHSVVHIHAPDIAKLLIPLPPRDTQDRVAALFMQADEAVAGRRAAADLFRRQKRGLMQKLLTGEWRVPATGDALVPGGPAADRLEVAE